MISIDFTGTIGVTLLGLLLIVYGFVRRSLARRFPIILVCGATGVGKSTLINTLAEREAARTGIGAPVTQNTTRIEIPEKEIVFYDSKGLEVEEASQTYLLLVSDLLRLRFGPKPREHLDFLLMCLQEPQGRIDDAHREIAGLCEDLQIPYGIAITKALGDDTLAQEVRRAFPSARFVRSVRSLPLRLPGVPEPIPPEGLPELLENLRWQARWNVQAARRRARSAALTTSLSVAARTLAQSGGNSDELWLQFADAASRLLSISPSAWKKQRVELREKLCQEMVPGFFQRVLMTEFNTPQIDGALARRLVPVIMKRFADGSLILSAEDRKQVSREALELLGNYRPYRARFG